MPATRKQSADSYDGPSLFDLVKQSEQRPSRVKRHPPARSAIQSRLAKQEPSLFDLVKQAERNNVTYERPSLFDLVKQAERNNVTYEGPSLFDLTKQAEQKHANTRVQPPRAVKQHNRTAKRPARSAATKRSNVTYEGPSFFELVKQAEHDSRARTTQSPRASRQAKATYEGPSLFELVKQAEPRQGAARRVQPPRAAKQSRATRAEPSLFELVKQAESKPNAHRARKTSTASGAKKEQHAREEPMLFAIVQQAGGEQVPVGKRVQPSRAAKQARVASAEIKPKRTRKAAPISPSKKTPKTKKSMVKTSRLARSIEKTVLVARPGQRVFTPTRSEVEKRRRPKLTYADTPGSPYSWRRIGARRIHVDVISKKMARSLKRDAQGTGRQSGNQHAPPSSSPKRHTVTPPPLRRDASVVILTAVKTPPGAISTVEIPTLMKTALRHRRGQRIYTPHADSKVLRKAAALEIPATPYRNKKNLWWEE